MMMPTNDLVTLVNGTKQHEALMPTQQERIKEVWEVVGKFDPKETFEAFAETFLYSLRIDREITIYETIADAMRLFGKKNPLDQRHYVELVRLSAGATGGHTGVSPNLAAELAKCWEEARQTRSIDDTLLTVVQIQADSPKS